MLSKKLAIVEKILEDHIDITTVEVNSNGEISKAINYKDLTGNINIGDKIVINTTARELSLGTGGVDFVIYNYTNKEDKYEGKGHIMKLRYTPYQMGVLACEEENSPYHEIIKNFKSLDGHKVIVATLHSMLGPICASLKYIDKDLNITYIMTDGASIPISFSKNVKELKEKSIIDNTITINQAFGGDYECVNIYTGLITSKEVLKSDVTIIALGPGIVGTSTKYGFSGVEQSFYSDAVNNLGGKSIIVPRVSFQDKRDRHYGLSHHTITILSELTNTKSDIVFHQYEEDKYNLIQKTLLENNIIEKHNIKFCNGEIVKEAMDYYKLNTKVMGRGINEDIEYFLTLGAIANYVSRLE